MTTDDYVNFMEIAGPPSGKTKMWSVFSKMGVALGQVRWYPQWRGYVFAPAVDTIFDKACLDKITKFVSKKTEEHYGRLRGTTSGTFQRDD